MCTCEHVGDGVDCRGQQTLCERCHCHGMLLCCVQVCFGLFFSVCLLCLVMLFFVLFCSVLSCSILFGFTFFCFVCIAFLSFLSFSFVHLICSIFVAVGEGRG